MKILRFLFKDILSTFDIFILFIILQFSFTEQFILIIFTVIFGGVISGSARYFLESNDKIKTRQ